LKPGGYVFLRTNAQSYPVVHDDLTYNFHKYTPNELRSKVEAAGLSPVRLSRVNALLGLAEIPRELRARRTDHSAEYRGILAEARPEPPFIRALKRGWLKFEGRAVRYGVELPAGRTIVALCRKAPEVPGAPGGTQR
jgi:hypothetical protein